MSRRFDFAVVGAGMAGASLAAELSSGGATVLLLEAEDQPGYHATGRSAAFWSPSYGGPLIQPLTMASGPFLADGFLRPRGAIYIARAEGHEALGRLRDRFSGSEAPLEPVDAATLRRIVPGLRPDWDSGLWERSCADIDVAALHSFYLKAARANGTLLVASAPLMAARKTAKNWSLETGVGPFACDVLINAAGAWADQVAGLAGAEPLGVTPYRRTIAQLRVDPPAPPDLPLVLDALERFYFKPEAGGRLWLSPHDETPSDPCDISPDEYDVALAIDRLQQAVDWQVERVEHRWAGLRSFAPDRLPIYGFPPGRRDFFWFAGQGGFGIQTAPAASMLAAFLLLGGGADPSIAAIDPSPYLAERFRN
ncbi:NAD(P)/FAD-dependent oxidoreductase [Sphingosinicella rhizophila]|uniref:FAD-binding oxidoreductase n=1 Tax=Sphingosinicella rhizophila TaxID=3050082 RepID=A0ABU3Q4X5_9SPHN|nr:FAD-binding oxidoreductase [Sphingosinicella sp. GR2756]MDT9598461.1 FAD-binding oxidoreductase [Sphingosinicella sp. GR2756]